MAKGKRKRSSKQKKIMIEPDLITISIDGKKIKRY